MPVCLAEDLPFLRAVGKENACSMSRARWGFTSSTLCPGYFVVRPPVGAAPDRPHTHLVAHVIGDQRLLYGRDAPIHHVRGGNDVAACRERPEILRPAQGSACLQEATPGISLLGPKGRVWGPHNLPRGASGGWVEASAAQSESTPTGARAGFAFGPVLSERGEVCKSQVWALLPGDCSPALA